MFNTMSDQFTGFTIANAEQEGDRYRWYLCIEKHMDSWSCQRVSQETAITYYSEKSRTKTVPIHYTNPPLLDRLYIRASLIPDVKITKSACAERGPE
jgi:hypothetical protein